MLSLTVIFVPNGDLPLLDPERDLVALSRASNRDPRIGLMLDAVAGVRLRIAVEKLRKAGSPTSGPSGQPFPVVPGVAVLHPLSEPELRRRALIVVECLRQLVRRYPGDQELQEFLDVPPALHRWILQQPESEFLTIDLCRLDLLGDSLGTVRVLEFNPSSPGGVISVGMVNRFWRESSLGAQLTEWDVPAAPFEEPEWFADWLLGYGQAHGAAENNSGRVGVFHQRLSTKFELDQVCAQLKRRGRIPVELQPTDIGQFKDLRLGYLKHIPGDAREVECWDVFCSLITNGELVIPNTLAMRWVAENKLCLAALSDPRFRHLFTAQQQTVLDGLVPFSRKLGDGITVARTLAERTRLVLKAPYGRGGESVVIGMGTTADAWSRLIQAPVHRGWLVQERIQPLKLLTGDGTYFRDLMIMVQDGQVIGYGSRMNQGYLLNGSQGGVLLSVFSPHHLNDLHDSSTDEGGANFAGKVAMGAG